MGGFVVDVPLARPTPGWGGVRFWGRWLCFAWRPGDGRSKRTRGSSAGRPRGARVGPCAGRICATRFTRPGICFTWCHF